MCGADQDNQQNAISFLMDSGVIVAAVIGAGGSVIGGLVGGWLALVAGHRQWQRDSEAQRAERSRAAAMLIAESVAELEKAVVIYAAGESDSIGLRVAFNVFAQTAGVQAIALADRDLRSRVRNHVEWVGTFAAIADQRQVEAVLVEPMRRHADALIDALDSHVNDLPLPPYQPPPLGDAAALIEWQPVGTPGSGPLPA